MRNKGKKYRPIVTILKIKSGIPTVIKVSGNEYILRHKDQYEPNKKFPPEKKMIKGGDSMDGYINLANAIIDRAISDYRSRFNKLLKKELIDEHGEPIDCDCEDAAEMTQIENFIKSDYFTTLTEADPNYILERLKEWKIERYKSVFESNSKYKS